jgi:putative transcriptional regulator
MMVGKAMERRVRVKIKELLAEYDISLRKLSLMTDIGHSILSELSNQKRKSIYFEHLVKIADALDIEDMNKIIEFEYIEEP